jgi:hypothetical protein
MQGTDTVKFTKSLQLIWYGHVERMQSQQTVAGYNGRNKEMSKTM